MKVLTTDEKPNVADCDSHERPSKANEIEDLLKCHADSAKRIEHVQLVGVSEILPSLYLCGAGATCPDTLDKLGIGFVINVAPELPDTPLPDNRPLYLKVPAFDRVDVDLRIYFDEVADLIESVRQNNNGRTLVHCVAGVSRSATLCLAYLIKHTGMSLRDAFLHVRSVRPQIRPNTGFFRQLIAYELKLTGLTTVAMVFCAAVGAEIPDVYEPEYRAMEMFYQKHRQNFKRR